MKVLLSAFLALSIYGFTTKQPSFYLSGQLLEGVEMEAVTKYNTQDKALDAAKKSLVARKFVISDDNHKTRFTGYRYNEDHSAYIVAYVFSVEESGKIKITISFHRIGNIKLDMQKIADEVKVELEN